MFTDYVTERHVTVIDTTPPVIELKHIEGYEASWMDGYEEEGYTAFDSCDGDLTSKVIRTEDKDKVTYTVTDSSGNTATAVREIKYAKTEPRIILNGDENMVFTARTDFTGPRLYGDGRAGGRPDLACAGGQRRCALYRGGLSDSLQPNERDGRVRQRDAQRHGHSCEQAGRCEPRRQDHLPHL